MSGDLPFAMQTEFDDLAGWTEDILKHRNRKDAIAAACRGSGNPAVLAWLAEAMQIDPSMTFLDVGGGLGGPAAWLQDHYGPRIVIAEPMPHAAAGAHRLWNIPSAVAWAEHLPFPGATFAAGWALGVLDTTPHKAELLAELHRVVRPAGQIGLLVYERTTDNADREAFPAGNEFPNTEEVRRLLDASGWSIATYADVSSFPPPPLSWQAGSADAEDHVAAGHDSDHGMTDVHNQQHQMQILIQERIVVARLYHATRT